MKNSTFDHVRLAARSFALTLGICALVIGTVGTGIALANNPTPGVCTHSYCRITCGGAPPCVGGVAACAGPAGSICPEACDKGCAATARGGFCECQGSLIQ